MTTSTQSMTPVEIDTELSRIWGQIARVQADLRVARQRLQSPRNDQSYWSGKVSDLESRLACLRHEAEPFETEYASRPWRRYFLVDNTNGHVHRGMDCSTCFITTVYSWLIDLADCDEAKMIEEWGEMACTVCFPDAPTNPNYHRPSRRDRETREARDAEKKARDAAKSQKAITAPDGSPLRGEYGIIRTKVAARNELSLAVQSYVFYGPSHPSKYADLIVRYADALEAAGIDPKPVIERAEKKAVREGGSYRATNIYIPKGAA